MLPEHSRQPGACRHALTALAVVLAAATLSERGLAQVSDKYDPPRTPKPIPPAVRTVFHLADAEVDLFVRAPQARAQFEVSGRGLSVVVIDTGLNDQHKDFQGSGKVIPGRNFSTDGEPDDTTDFDGHGSNVAGIIAGRQTQDGGLHTGIAHDARVVPLKVFPGGDFDRINDALQWVIDHRDAHNITVVNMSLGTSQNAASSDAAIAAIPQAARPSLVKQRELIRKLREMDVAVVVSAGNDYFNTAPAEGMGFPGICQETISVGAVFDTVIPKRSDGAPLVTYVDGGKVLFTRPGRCTPFSQRLSESKGGTFRTDVFAPGFLITSAGPVSVDSPDSSQETETIQDGTSQAAPVTAGLVLLLQERYATLRNAVGVPGADRPTVDLLEECLREGGVKFVDAEDQIGMQIDNVKSTDVEFIRIDAVNALTYLERKFQGDRGRLQAELFMAQPAGMPAAIQKHNLLGKPLAYPKPRK